MGSGCAGESLGLVEVVVWEGADMVDTVEKGLCNVEKSGVIVDCAGVVGDAACVFEYLMSLFWVQRVNFGDTLLHSHTRIA